MTDYKYFSHTFPKICKKCKIIVDYFFFSLCVCQVGCMPWLWPDNSTHSIVIIDASAGLNRPWRSCRVKERSTPCCAACWERWAWLCSCECPGCPNSCCCCCCFCCTSACWSSAGSDAPRGERCIKHHTTDQPKLSSESTLLFKHFSMVQVSFYLYSTFTIATRLTNVLYRRARLYNMHRKQLENWNTV